MVEKCLFIDSDDICAVTGGKCDDPKDTECPSYEPGEVVERAEEQPDEE